MPAKIENVTFYQPRPYEVGSIRTTNDGAEIVPAGNGLNRYTPVCHLVVRMKDGMQQVGKVEVNAMTGELRMIRRTVDAEGGEA